MLTSEIRKQTRCSKHTGIQSKLISGYLELNEREEEVLD